MGHPSLHTTLRTHTQFSTPTHGDFAVPRAASTSALSPRRGVTLSCCEVFHNGPKDICVVVWVLRGQSAGPTGNDRAEREREDGIVQCSLLVRHGRHSCLSPGGCAIRSCSAKGCIKQLGQNLSPDLESHRMWVLALPTGQEEKQGRG